jgi:hypothetical protein
MNLYKAFEWALAAHTLQERYRFAYTARTDRDTQLSAPDVKETCVRLSEEKSKIYSIAVATEIGAGAAGSSSAASSVTEPERDCGSKGGGTACQSMHGGVRQNTAEAHGKARQAQHVAFTL